MGTFCCCFSALNKTVLFFSVNKGDTMSDFLLKKKHIGVIKMSDFFVFDKLEKGNILNKKLI